MTASSYSFLVGPLMAFGALGVILLLCRWVFAPPPSSARRAPAASSRGSDYGLLVPVTTVRTADDAEMLRSVLREAGIRCTITRTGTAADPDAADVLVFGADAPRARELVSS